MSACCISHLVTEGCFLMSEKIIFYSECLLMLTGGFSSPLGPGACQRQPPEGPGPPRLQSSGVGHTGSHFHASWFGKGANTAQTTAPFHLTSSPCADLQKLVSAATSDSHGVRGLHLPGLALHVLCKAFMFL